MIIYEKIVSYCLDFCKYIWYNHEAIICLFCKFGIMAWLDGAIDENGESTKDKSKQYYYLTFYFVSL